MMQKMDKTALNFANKVNVLETLWENHSIFKAEVARLTNLSFPTVMKIIDEFAAKGLVNATGKGVSSGGKPPLMLEFNKDAYYVIGIDINEYRIEVVLMNLLLGLEDQRIQDIRSNDTSDIIIARVIREITSIIDGNEEKSGRIIGIGLGVPGIVDAKRGFVTYSSELNWYNVDIMAALKDVFDTEIIIDESTRAIAMEEKLLGLGKGVNNFLCISLGDGIGSAMVMNGKLYYGSSESSGQLGHMAVEKDGIICDCGNHGCLELYSSGKAIERQARKVVSQGRYTQIGDLVYGELDKIDVYVVFEAAQNHDPVALEILKTAADYLGMAVAGVINFLDPEMIIMEGKISRTGDLYIRMFKEALKERRMKYLGKSTEIIVSRNKSYTGSIGAASFIFERFINRGGEVEQILRGKKMEEIL